EGEVLAEAQDVQPSVFTSALVEGLATGAADLDEDGLISLNELYEYVFDRVRERNPNQTPSRDIEMPGELYLARSGRRRIRAMPIPADLRAAIADPNMFARLGAIGELQARLGGANLAAAAGALEALRDIADTDIQNVADRARTVLREAAPTVSSDTVHLGPVGQGTPAPHRVVPVHGPPIARAGTVETSERWLHAEPTAGGVDVSVDTAAAGELGG